MPMHSQFCLRVEDCRLLQSHSEIPEVGRCHGRRRTKGKRRRPKLFAKDVLIVTIRRSENGQVFRNNQFPGNPHLLAVDAFEMGEESANGFLPK
jgi:hypothetical protein